MKGCLDENLAYKVFRWGSGLNGARWGLDERVFR